MVRPRQWEGSVEGHGLQCYICMFRSISSRHEPQAPSTTTPHTEVPSKTRHKTVCWGEPKGWKTGDCGRGVS